MNDQPEAAPPGTGVTYQWTWWRIFIAAYLFALTFGVLGRLSNGIVRFEIMDVVAPAVIAAVVALGWWLLRGRRTA